MSNPIDPTSVFVVVPAFNEKTSLPDVVRALTNEKYQVVVVDDGSTEPLDELLDNLPVYLVRHPINLGQGAALQTGIEFALEHGATFIVTFDADGQHQVSDIPVLLQPLLEKRADLVCGSRFLVSGNQQLPAGRKTLLQIARFLNVLVTGQLLSDAHNGLRAMTAPAATKIRIRQNGMAHASEIIEQARRHALRLVEVPVTILYTDYSRRKGQTGWNGFRIIFDILADKLFR